MKPIMSISICTLVASPMTQPSQSDGPRFSLCPSEGERVGVSGQGLDSGARGRCLKGRSNASPSSSSSVCQESPRTRRRAAIFGLLLALLALTRASAQTFVGTNAPGQGSNFTFTAGVGATNLSLVVSNNATAYSYLL